MIESLDLTKIQDERARQAVIILLSRLTETVAADEYYAAIQESVRLLADGRFDRALVMAWCAVEVCQDSQLKALSLRHASFCQLALKLLPGAADSLRRAIAEMRRLPIAEQPKYDLALCMDDLAVALHRSGHHEEALETQQAAQAVWGELPNPDPLVEKLSKAADNHHRYGQYLEALDAYAQALKWNKDRRKTALLLSNQADVYQDLKDYTAAKNLYNQALAELDHVDDPSLRCSLYLALARLACRTKDYLTAQEMVQRAAGISPTNVLHLKLEQVVGILHLQLEDIPQGRLKLRAVAAQLEHSGSLTDLAQALLWQACAEFRGGDRQLAASSLTRAITIAENVGYDRMLATEVDEVSDLLTTFVDQAEIGEYVRSLIAQSATLTHKTKTRIKIRALGSVQVFNSQEITPTLQPLTRKLLLFIVDRAPVERDQVLEAFWPDKPVSQSANSLSQTIRRLHIALGCKLVLVDNQVYRIDPDVDLEYDVSSYETVARLALSLPPGDDRLQAFARATQYFVGDYMADMYAEWVEPRRRAINRKYIDLVEAYASDLMRVANYAQTRDILVRALLIEPLSDTLNEQMLICLSQLGRRHELVDHYHRYNSDMNAELGLPPPPHIIALYDQLIRDV